MKRLLALLAVLLVVLLTAGCAGVSMAKEQSYKQGQNSPAGYVAYTDEGYFKRDEGYDFIAILVYGGGQNLKIKVRSRSDKKRPTCTFDAEARLVKDDFYMAKVDGIIDVFFKFKKDILEIVGAKNELRYFCSGGGSLAGKYQRLDEKLDDTFLNID